MIHEMHGRTNRLPGPHRRQDRWRGRFAARTASGSRWWVLARYHVMAVRRCPTRQLVRFGRSPVGGNVLGGSSEIEADMERMTSLNGSSTSDHIGLDW